MKDTSTLKLEVAGELLKLEARLEGGLGRNMGRTPADHAAMNAIRFAHNQLLGVTTGDAGAQREAQRAILTAMGQD